MNNEILEAVKLIEKEKGINLDKVYIGLENCLLAACKSIYGACDNIAVNVSKETGDIKIIANKVVVEEIEGKEHEVDQIVLQKAREVMPEAELGDIVQIELDYRKFSRIAAQNAKSILQQTVREEERLNLFEYYQKKEKTLINGVIERKIGDKISINIGKLDAIIPLSEQIAGESYNPGQRMKVYISDVKMGNKGPRITASRTHPDLVKCLFENEVSEIKDGIVEIKAVAREAGSRTKMGVSTNDPDIDPVGACVGLNVARVNAIINELRGEKIDIVNWCEDPALLIENALSPASVISVDVNEEAGSAFVVVPDYQLSLAIGKEGQNARLAVKLTNYRIDIKSESQYEEMLANKNTQEADATIEEAYDVIDMSEILSEEVE